MKKILFVILVIFTGIFNFCSVKDKDMAIDRKNMDLKVNPGNDFYQYANGGWINNNPLPDEYSRYGSFDKLAEDNQKMLKTLAEEASASNATEGSVMKKIGDFYLSGMDSANIEEMGIKAISPELFLINSAESKDDIQNIIFSLHKNNNQLLFHIFGSPDKANSKMVIANLYQGGLGLTDVDYYTSEESRAKEIRLKYQEYMTDMLSLSGEENAGDKTKIIYSIEEQLAKASMTRLERRDPHKTNNKMSIEKLAQLAPEIDWKEYLNSCGLSSITEINVSQPLFFTEISHMLKDIPVKDWQLYLKWHLVNKASTFLSSDFLNLNFNFYGKYLSGRKILQPAWKRVLRTQDYALGEAIGQIFVEKYFPPQAKERMLDLVGNLKAALGERIDQLDWMSEPTKKQAHLKLDAMNVKIGYPDSWRDYSALEIQKTSYYENIKKAGSFNFQFEMSKIGKEVDPDEWGMTPQTVNAYYSPSRNEIVFPAGILQPPFFFMNADDAVNYGAIGMVIGHEMTHGFDDQGRQYDRYGNLKDWWTAEDAELFNQRTKVLVDQFNGYSVSDSVKANGELTLGENIADLGGMNISFTALKKAWEQNPPQEKTDGFTPAQRFFLAYAHVWAANITDKEMLRRTKEDVHSLGNLRVNGPLRNIEEFYTAFGLDENSELYLPEEERASIW